MPQNVKFTSGTVNNRTVEMVEIDNEGDGKNVVVREATPDDKGRFAAQYADFQKSSQQAAPAGGASQQTQARPGETGALGAAQNQQGQGPVGGSPAPGQGQ